MGVLDTLLLWGINMKAFLLGQNNVILNIVEIDDISLLPNLISYIDGGQIGDQVIDGIIIKSTANSTPQKDLHDKETQVESSVVEYNGGQYPADGNSMGTYAIGLFAAQYTGATETSIRNVNGEIVSVPNEDLQFILASAWANREAIYTDPDFNIGEQNG